MIIIKKSKSAQHTFHKISNVEEAIDIALGDSEKKNLFISQNSQKTPATESINDV